MTLFFFRRKFVFLIKESTYIYMYVIIHGRKVSWRNKNKITCRMNHETQEKNPDYPSGYRSIHAVRFLDFRKSFSKSPAASKRKTNTRKNISSYRTCMVLCYYFSYLILLSFLLMCLLKKMRGSTAMGVGGQFVISIFLKISFFY